MLVPLGFMLVTLVGHVNDFGVMLVTVVGHVGDFGGHAGDFGRSCW